MAVGGQPSAVSYTYDDNGNLLNDGQFSYTYDSANRLTQLSGSTLTTQYEYNGDGVRVAQIVNGLRTDTVQDVALPLPQVLTAKQDTTTAKYLRGLGLIGEQQGGGAWQYHLADALGSVRQVVDAQGQVQLSQRYDPFGGVESVNGLTSSRYGFAGEEQDPDTEQLFLRARTYNPGTGRFLQQDAVLGSPTDPRSLHRYAYAFNNPVNYVDPSGLMPPGNYSGRHDFQQVAPPVTNYAAAPQTQVGHIGLASLNSGGFNEAYLGRNDLNFGPPNRSINGPDGQTWQPYSDPGPKQQSQGHRPRACGVLDVMNGLFQTVINGNVVEEAFDAAMHGPELALLVMPMEGWHLAFQLTTALNPYDYIMDIGSLMTGTDWLTGEELTDFDKAALLFGVFTGIGDEIAKLGKKVMQAEKVHEGISALKRGKGLLGGLKNLVAKGWAKLDDLNNKSIREIADEIVQGFKKKVGRFFGGSVKVADETPPSGLLNRVGRKNLGERVQKHLDRARANRVVRERLEAVGSGAFGSGRSFARRSQVDVPKHSTLPLHRVRPEAMRNIDLHQSPNVSLETHKAWIQQNIERGNIDAVLRHFGIDPADERIIETGLIEDLKQLGKDFVEFEQPPTEAMVKALQERGQALLEANNGDNLLIGVRSIPLGSEKYHGFLPAKPVGAKALLKGPHGIRIIIDKNEVMGPKGGLHLVVSDLDMGVVIMDGKVVDLQRVNEFFVDDNVYNDAFAKHLGIEGAEILGGHGDQVNGQVFVEGVPHYPSDDNIYHVVQVGEEEQGFERIWLPQYVRDNTSPGDPIREAFIKEMQSYWASQIVK